MKTHNGVTGLFGRDQLTEYAIDAGQRTILYWDTIRQRGNQFSEHMAHKTPHVLGYEFELIVDGITLPEPVNYGLVKIHPPEGVTIDNRKRPFVVADPRGGHQAGIGCFKADSEIGMILAEGHPCYFIGFTLMPEPGQTIEAVIHAMAFFLKKVNEMHLALKEHQNQELLKKMDQGGTLFLNLWNTQLSHF